MLGTVLVVLLVLMLIGSLPTWPHSRNWGYGPTGGLGVVLAILVVLLLLGMLVFIKQIATGAILEKPTGSLRVWAVNAFNLFFLLIANPLVAILLITQQLEAVDPTHLAIGVPLEATIAAVTLVAVRPVSACPRLGTPSGCNPEVRFPSRKNHRSPSRHSSGFRANPRRSTSAR